MKPTALALTTIALISLLPLPAAADRDAAADSFRAAHPGARLADDGATHRFFLASGFATAPIDGDLVDGARAMLLEHAGLFGLAAAETGVELDRVVPHLGSRYVRFRQTIHGLPVFGASAAVHVDEAGRVVKISSSAVPTAGAADAPLIDATEAGDITRLALTAAGEPWSVDLGYLARGGQPILSWRVVAPTAGPHLFETFVDAEDGRVLLKRDVIRRDHQALVFLENPTVDEEVLTEVTLSNFVTDGVNDNHTWGQFVHTATCVDFDNYGNCGVREQYAVATAENGFLDVAPVFDPGYTTDGFAEVETYYAIDTFHRWYRDEFGFAGQFVDVDTTEPSDHIWVFVNYPFENAMFIGGGAYGYPDSIIIGQGTRDFAYDNDVVCHEFTHAVAAAAFDIYPVVLDSQGLDLTGGGIEEGNADYFPVSYHGNPVLSEYIGIARNADNFARCPTGLMGESHHDGMIISGTMWEIRETVGQRKADHLHYGTLAGNTTHTFTQYGLALREQAQWMGFEEDESLRFTAEEVELVDDVVQDRNLINCERIVNLGVNGSALHYMQYDYLGSGSPSGVQYKASTTADTQVLDFKINAYGDKRHDVYVKEGEPISFSWSGANFSTNADMVWLNSELGEVTNARISNITELEIKPNANYYYSVTCRAGSNSYGCQNQIKVDISDEPEEQPDPPAEEDPDAGADAGADGGDGGDDGDCDCRVGAPRGPAGSLVRLLIDVL